MGKRAPSPPPAPDPYAVAKAQGEANVNTAIANTYMGNANEFGPNGSVIFDQYGTRWVDGKEVPLYNRITNLSPGQKKLYDQEEHIGQMAGDVAEQQMLKIGNLLNTDPATVPGFGRLGSAPSLDRLEAFNPGNVAAGRDRAEAALMGRLNPQLQQGRSALDTQLRNQGLIPGTEAYNAAIDAAGRQENDARLAVISQAGQEQDRDYEQAFQTWQSGLNRAGFNNQAAANEFGMRSNALTYDNSMSQQDYENRLQTRAQPINEIGALMGLGQVQIPKGPAFQAGEVAGTPVGQYVYQSADINQRNWAAQQQARAQTMSGLFGLGKSALGLIPGMKSPSDRRLKEDIRPLDIELPNGLPLYSFRYIGTGDAVHVGVMADEVERIMPEAVVTMSNGFKAVDYRMVL